MSHDDRIRQLSDLFIDDLRGPIESSLRQLLAQLMTIAHDDRAAAVQDAVDKASADHRSALEAALQAARDEHERALEAALRAAHEDHARDLDALKAEHEGALQDARDEHDRAMALATEDQNRTLDTAAQDREAEHMRVLDALRTELAEQQRQAIASAHEQASADRDAALDALRAELAREREDALLALQEREGAARESAVQAARDEAAATHEASLASQRDELTAGHAAALDALRGELARDYEAALAAAVERARGEGQPPSERADLEDAVATLTRERDAARSSVAELADTLAATRAQQEQMSELAQSESAAAEEMLAAASVVTRVEERQSGLACSERLLAAFRDLDNAASLTDVLSVLAEHAGSETSRVAVLLVQNGRLRGWRQGAMGDVQTDVIDVAIEQAGILGRAAATGVPASTSEAPAAALPPSLAAPADRVGLALPLVVGGRVVAVLYADAAGEERQSVPSNWPETVELLVRHASRCLEVLTLSRATAAPRRPAPDVVAPAPSTPATPPALAGDREQEEESARRHARLLISEIKLYNEALVEQGRRDGNLLGLLGPEIERARRLYEEKIPAAVRQRVDCFDEEIVRTLAGGDRALLGQTT